MSDARPTVFFSWQSDTVARTNRQLIRNALDAVCAALADSPDVNDSPRADDGMAGVAGSPEVASVMFQKIDAAAIFVGDMTLVGRIESADGRSKRVPNPNVLTEMGYAAARLGWSRVINVMNEHYGPTSELPFDVRNRRFPITYTMAPDDTSDAALKALTRSLRGAITTALGEQLRTAEEALARLDHECVDLFELNGDLVEWGHRGLRSGPRLRFRPRTSRSPDCSN